MTRDDIIRMARDAGCEIRNGHIYHAHSLDRMLARFAELAVAAEREECARACDEVEAGCLGVVGPYLHLAARDCAAAIRARGGA